MLASVDLGSSSISPHAEASFSPIRPSIIAFLCLDISPEAQETGLTTLIDGNKVWKGLNISTRKIIQNVLTINSFFKKKLKKNQYLQLPD